MNKIERVVKHQGTPGINVNQPSIELIIVLECEIILLLFSFQEETAVFNGGPFDVGEISEQDDGSCWCGLHGDGSLARGPEFLCHAFHPT